MWWHEHPELVLCNRCRKQQAEVIINNDFDNWLGSAIMGDFMCRECCAIIEMPESNLSVWRIRAIDLPPASPSVQ